MKTVGDIINGGSELPSREYWLVWAVLLLLLFVTWRVSYFQAGDLNILIAMSIAVVKSCLVLWYFMHLRGGPKLILMLFGMALVMFFVAGVLTMADYGTREELKDDRNSAESSPIKNREQASEVVRPRH